jgi:Asp-tRNA(Asn)/Glu-tRNA(Gln) amidotransferase A subunit family amidase
MKENAFLLQAKKHLNMKIYIAGKITGIDLEEAKANFQVMEEHLTELGHEVVNPMKLPHDHDKSWNSYMKECIAALMGCDSIYLLPNYHQSKGAMLELYIVIAVGIKVYS